ncbi:MAG: autotransporter outer membrane beta-barrel domain-containing protein [Verrucomicrobiales bacterium]|nr:autotransporter outer membrane beta-barrel domain-containing protein [Verrucomicrobiales bacterium]
MKKVAGIGFLVALLLVSGARADQFYWWGWGSDSDASYQHTWNANINWYYDDGSGNMIYGTKMPGASDVVGIDDSGYVRLTTSTTITTLNVGTGVSYYGNGVPPELRLEHGASLTTLSGTSTIRSNYSYGYYSYLPAVMSLTGTSTWNNSVGDLIIGGYGGGSLTIEERSTVTNRNLFFNGGASYDDTSYLRISGSGSQMINSGSISAYSGVIDILDKGLLSNADASFYGSSTVNVINASWNTNGNFSMGWQSGLNIQGSVVTDHNASIADDYTASNVMIKVNDSRWVHSGSLNLWGSGSGSLQVTNGSVVSNKNASVAAGAGAKGDVSVSGNSQWNTSGNLDFAASGSASLRVESGGQVNVSGILQTAANSDGVANLDIQNGARLNVGELALGSGSTNLNLGGNNTIGRITSVNPRDITIGDAVNGGGSTTINGVNDYQGNTTIAMRTTVTLNNANANFSTTGDVNNYGSIRLGGNGGHNLTINGNYIGNNAGLYMNTTLRGDSSIVDKLIVNGDTSGQTRIYLRNVGGQGGQTTGDGVQMIQVSGNSDPNAFVLDRPIGSGLYLYNLFYGDVDGNGGNWYLRSEKYLGAGGAIINTAGATSMAWFTQMDNIMKRMGEVRFQDDLSVADYIAGKKSAGELGVDFWVRSYGRQANANLGISGVNGFTDYLYGIDIGADKTWKIDANNAIMLGYFVGYGGAQRDFNFEGSEGETNSYYTGFYSTWVNKDGWYADLVTKGQYFDNSYDTYGYFDDHGSYGTWAGGASLEFGKRFKFDNGYFIEPSVQASYVRLFNENYTTREQVDVAVSDADIGQFWGGIRTGWTFKVHDKGSTLQPYIKIGAMEQISSGGQVRIGGDPEDMWRPNTDGLHGVGGAGLVFQMTEVDQFHLDYEAAFGDKYDVPWNINFGYRHQF